MNLWDGFLVLLAVVLAARLLFTFFWGVWKESCCIFPSLEKMMPQAPSCLGIFLLFYEFLGIISQKWELKSSAL